MKRTIYSVVLAFAAIALFLSPSSAVADKEHSFRFTVEMTYVGSDANGNLVYQGTTTVPHFGRTEQLARVGLPQAEGDPATGVITIYAANGDQIDLEFIQWWDPATHSYVGEYCITGGTGNFAYAAGTGTITTAPTPEGKVIVTCEGSFSY